MANIKSTEQNNKISVKSTTANTSIGVKPTNLNGKVTANTGVETNTFGIKDNMSEYYARISQGFASGEGIINGVDYSSKHYANVSKQYAEIVEQHKNETKSSIAGFNDLIETAESNLAQARVDALSAINDTGGSAVAMVETTRDEAVATVEETKANAIESLGQETENNKQEINALADVIKDNADSIINRVGLNMFDPVLKDHVLTYEESKGLALQGTWVYKEAITGERYGYPDFYAKVVEEYNEATGTETVNGVTVKVHSNGHKFYDIANKSSIDSSFNSLGSAWYYGVDTANERVFLPRNKYFDQSTGDVSEVGKSVEAGLPNITGSGIWAKASETPPVGAIYKAGGNSYSNTSSGGTANYHAFDASLSNPIYGNSDTVQPNAVKKLLYICVGNTIQDTSWVNVIEQVKNGAKDIEDKRVQSLNDIAIARTEIATDRANAIADIEQDRKQALNDLTNKENEGLSALSNASNTLRETQITNCIKEIPQRIKYTLVDGTLTIKAGSVVIVPYGTEDLTSQYPKGSTFIHENFKVYDTQFANSKFFVWAELVGDIIGSFDVQEARTSRQLFVSVYQNVVGSALQHISGDNPTTTTITWTLAYNTSTNLIGRTNNDTVFNYERIDSLPIMRVVSGAVSDGTIKAYASIDQVFNGMGYIGSTAWLDKGVKGLIPNGRNEDGTLNNIEFETSSIITRTTAGTENEYYFWCYRKDTNSFNYSPSSKVFYQTARPSGTNFRWYNPETNIWQVYGSTGNLETRQECPLWHCSLTNGAISNFQPKQPFRAVDYNDVQSLLNNIGDIGKPQISLDNNLPTNCIWLEGATVSRTTYAKLFELYGTTYGAGDGSTTFVLPDFRNRAIWGSNSFGYLSAGLPNITGTLGAIGGGPTTATGAFYDAGTSSAIANTGEKDGLAGFDASRSNAIYGNSNTVQPPAIKVRVYTKYQ